MLHSAASDLDLHCLLRSVSGVILQGDLEKKSLPKLADFSLSSAEGEVKMYSMYREIQNLDQNFFLKSRNCHKTSLSESFRMTPAVYLNTSMV